MVASVERLSFPAQTPAPLAHDNSHLLSGKILVDSCSQSGSGTAIARMYVPLTRSQIWPQLTNYSRWTEYFPNIVRSEVLETVNGPNQRYRRLYQVGRKGFCMLTAQVEIYLKVFETLCDRLQFRFERGTFSNFAAELTLEDCQGGTILTYSVSATPLIPVPGFLIEQAMRHDLPGNMEQMRQLLCR
ncbi:cyclase [filamentous cyanobacterium CCP5]|nr:cyclase [filamentous cyanobacterium CCP5]